MADQVVSIGVAVGSAAAGIARRSAISRATDPFRAAIAARAASAAREGSAASPERLVHRSPILGLRPTTAAWRFTSILDVSAC